MKHHNEIIKLVTPALLMAGCLVMPNAIRAEEIGDSAQISQLLSEAKAEAVELKSDSATLESFTRSKVSWHSFGDKLEMIKDHVNKTGKLLTQLKDVETTGAPWQQEAIAKIEPLLKELVANTEATITHLNDNQTKVHFPAFRDYVRANYQLATDLAEMIRDYVDYGETKQNMDRLEQKLSLVN